eukprot:TRINITY_DN8938_c0_g1_i1.p1 TRINITY_DN8938_c0_g1~~TRINITY_DN8938_c0_g1_i1.p1  ORF type:complete len:311 (-),score=48.22 TRINITY_DN8938_c0_g1_i1:74-1006(-)
MTPRALSPSISTARCLCVLFVLLLPLATVHAVVVPAVIAEDTVWADVTEPYNVTGKVVLAAGKSLTILDGVTVTLEADAVLDLSLGQLSIAGSEDNGVEFESVSFDGTPEHTSGTIYVPAQAIISQATFAGLQAIDGKGADGVEVSDCVFEDNRFALSRFSNLLLQDSLLNDNYMAVVETNGLLATGTYFSGNQFAVLASGISMVNCALTNNVVAVTSYVNADSVGMKVSNCTISGSDFGFQLDDGDDAQVIFTSITDVQEIAHGHYTGKFGFNWFGTTDVDKIASLFALDATSTPAEKLVIPVLTAPPA